MSLWVDKTRGIHAVRMGSFPVISIAIERCITENLQGRSLNDTWDYLKNIPFSGASRDGLHKLLTIFKEDFPEKIYEPERVLSSVNEKVYFTGRPSNEEMLKRYISIFKGLDIDVYYRDTSISSNFASVQLHSPVLNMDLTPDYLKQTKEGAEELNSFMKRLKEADFSFSDCVRIAQGRDYAGYEFTQFLSYKFKNTCVRNIPYQYIKAIMCYYTDEYALAYELLTDGDADNIKSYEINKLKSYISYKLRFPFLGYEQILEKLSVWGYEPGEFKEILLKDNSFLKLYLSDAIWDKAYEEEVALLREIRGHIDRARKKLREKE